MNKIACLAAFFLALIVGASAQNDNYSWNHLPSAELPKFKKDTFNIIKYGAVSDGITLNTKSINDAINDCNAKGGGVVLIPQGLWMTGPIVLKSNVNLHIVNSALVQFTDDKSQYQLVLGDFEGHPSPRNQSPISGTDLTNIAITGEGIIDGHGEVWRNIAKESLIESDWKKLVASGGVVSENGKEWYPSVGFLKGEKTKDAIKIQPGKTLADYQDMKDFFRPNLVVLNNCKKVLLQNTTFRNSPAWCLHILCCEDLTVQGARVRNNWNAHNGDALDVESCKNILIEGSTFDAGDDGICVKSGRDEDGRKRGIPTENMVVRDCIVYRAHGGFVIGSEMSGGARNIFVSNCTFIGTDIGLRFKTTRGRGGIVEKIFIKDISMKDIAHEAILFDMYYMVKSDKKETFPFTEATPQFRDFYVNNIVCDGAEKAIMVRGLPEMSIKGIHLENMTLKTKKGVELIEAEDISLKNITVFCSETNPVVLIDNGNKITLENIKYTSNSDLLFSINGEKSAAITVSKTDVSKAKNKVTFNGGSTDKALIITNN
jgi:polygalacturonase